MSNAASWWRTLLADDRDGARLIVEHIEALATIKEASVQRNLLKELVRDFVSLEARVDSLLNNTLPPSVAEEVKLRGRFEPRQYNCSILFTDLVRFTALAEVLRPDQLLHILDRLFSSFDELTERHGGTKVKTIGDAYMAVFGAPEALEDHASQAVACGLAMVRLLDEFTADPAVDLGLRVGIHSGDVIAGVVGRDRMQFDVFGDAVNLAARLETAGQVGRVNVSDATRSLAGVGFNYEDRGRIPIKNKAPTGAHFVIGARREDQP